jgi:hypothetical protein
MHDRKHISQLRRAEKETDTMKTNHIARIVLIASLALISWIAAPSADAASKKPKASTPPTQSEGRSTVASGAVEDTTSACQTRIPKDATGGQRLMAEDSCKRDQASRQSIEATPGR